MLLGMLGGAVVYVVSELRAATRANIN